MIFEYFVALLMLALVVLSFVYFRDFIHPAFVLSAVYFIVIIIFVISRIITKSIYKLPINSLYFVLGVLIFFIGTIIGGRNKKFTIFPLIEKNAINITLLFKFVVIVQFIILVIFLFDFCTTTNFSDKLTLYEFLTAYKDGKYVEKYVFKLARTISIAISIVCIYYLFSKSINKNDFYLFIIQIIIACIHTFLVSSRFIWFQLLIPASFIIMFIFYKDNKTFIKNSALVLFSFILLTIIVTFLRGQIPGIKELRIYANSGMISFCEWMKNPTEHYLGAYTFRFIIKVLNKLRLVSIPTYWIEQRSINVDGCDWWVGNVYSFYHGYAQDFGIYFALFVQLLVGIWHGFLYYMTRKTRESFWICLFAFFYYALVLQFFVDCYASLISFWIQIGIILLLSCKTKLFFVIKN